jgi:hypothetical protein
MKDLIKMTVIEYGTLKACISRALHTYSKFIEILSSELISDTVMNLRVKKSDPSSNNVDYLYVTCFLQWWSEFPHFNL